MKFKLQASGFVKEVSLSLIVYQALMSVGYGRSYIVFLFHQLDLPGSQIVIDVEQKSRIAGSIGLLSPFACIFSGALMDLFGRRLFFFTMFIPQIISWVMITMATSYEMLLYGMIIQGINLGMGFNTSTYVSEIATSSRRGALLGGLTVSYCFGVTICNTLMYFLSWNTVAWIYAALSTLALLSTLLLLESPIWLYNKGKQEAAVRALCSLRGSNVDGVKAELDDMEKFKKPKASFLKTLKNMLDAWRQFLMSVSLQLLFQLTGYTILFAYTILMFDRLRLPIDSSKFTIVYSIASVLGAMCAPVCMYWMNRRTHLSLSAGIMVVCTAVVGVYEEIFYDNDEKPYPFIVSFAFYVFSFASNGGVLPISYTVCSEMFPSEVKGVLGGIFGAVWYITWSVILKLYPTIIKTIPIKIILWSFVVFCLSVIAFSTFILPETKGKTLNEVQEQYFQKKKKPVESNNA